MRILPSDPVQIPTFDPGGRPQKVLLIGFQDQDNLGLRYLMSAVNASGHQAFIMTYGSDPGPILKRIRTRQTGRRRVLVDLSVHGARLWPGHRGAARCRRNCPFHDGRPLRQF